MSKPKELPSLSMNRVPLAQAIQQVQLRQAAETHKTYVPIISGRPNPIVAPVKE